MDRVSEEFLNVRKHIDLDATVIGPGKQRMKLQYGVNQADQCWDFAWGRSVSAFGHGCARSTLAW
jgi:hypothetical protein